MPLPALSLAQAAIALGQARTAPKPVEPLPPDVRPADEEDAYRVQMALTKWFERNGGGEPAGYKVGATTQSMQDYLGVEGPAYGRIMSANVFDDGVSVSVDKFVLPGAECEVAFRLGEALETDDAPWSPETLVPKIAGCAPAIEIVDNRYGKFLRIGTPTLIADDFFHSACVLGAEASNWQDVDMAAMSCTMTVDGEEVGRGTGAEVMEHPLEALAWLANTRAYFGRPVEAGSLVLTGSITPVHWIQDVPAKISVDLPGLGSVSFSLSA